MELINRKDMIESKSIFMLMGTVLLYFISKETMHEIAGIATILAALTTAALNLKRFFTKK